MSAARTFLVAVLLASALSCGPAPKRPNVLMISIDTLRADHLGAYGYARPTSPEIDAFAKTACVFESAHSSASWTLPSLASIHTSLLSTTHGCWKIRSRLGPTYTTLAEVMRDAGYDTAMVACHLFLSAQYGLQQGFTHVDDTLIRTAQDSDKAISSPGVTAKGLAFLEEKAQVADGVPWFLWLHYFDPHDEYLPHAGFSEQFGTEKEIDLYDGEIAFTDHYVGRVLKRLSELHLDDDTIVVVLADHGEEFGEHGFKRHGYSLYEEAVRIPLLVRAPGLAPRRVGDVVSNVDVMPTLLELAKIDLHELRGPRCASGHPLEGASLVSFLRDGTGAPRDAVSEVRWHDDQDMRALCTSEWKYHEDASKAQAVHMLFDRRTDRAEQHDVLAEQPAAARELGDELIKRVGHALGLAKCYPQPLLYEPSPGDLQRLKGLGYAGNDAAPPQDGGKHASK